MVRKTSVKLLLSVDRIAIVLTHGELLKIITAGQKKSDVRSTTRFVRGEAVIFCQSDLA